MKDINRIYKGHEIEIMQSLSDDPEKPVLAFVEKDNKGCVFYANNFTQGPQLAKTAIDNEDLNLKTIIRLNTEK